MANETYSIEIPIIVDDQLDAPLQQAERKINRFEKSAQKTNDRMVRMFGREIKLRIGAVDRVSSIARSIKSNLRGLTSKAWDVTLRVKDKASGVLRGITGGIRKVAGLLTSPLALLGVGGGVGGITKFGIDMVVERENITMAFETLLGSADKAAKRVKELTTFAGETPFLRDDIYETSRILEVFTKGALSTSQGLRLVGDVAAGTKQEYKEVGIWIGRLYDAMASGRPVGEMTARLQEMGAISGKDRAQLEKLADSGKKISETWPLAAKAFSRFEGQMERMSTGLGNLLLSVKSFFRETVLMRWGQGIEKELRPVLVGFRKWRKENPEQVKAMGDAIEGIARSGMAKVVGFFKNGYALISDIINDESLTWSEKVSAALDRILKAVSDWLDGPGGEMMTETGTTLGTLLAAGLDGAIPNIVPVALKLGREIGKGILSGVYESLSGSPLGAMIAGGILGFAVGGPMGAATGAGAGLAMGAAERYTAGGQKVTRAETGKTIATSAAYQRQAEASPYYGKPGSTKYGGTSISSGGKRNAWGGFINIPTMGLVGEAGPEAIIPLSHGKRGRALSLYEETGRRLGVQPNTVPVRAPAMAGAGGNANINFDLSGLVGQVVINNQDDIDDVINIIADSLRKVFQNMVK